jgi:hypothetical protein
VLDKIANPALGRRKNPRRDRLHGQIRARPQDLYCIGSRRMGNHSQHGKDYRDRETTAKE